MTLSASWSLKRSFQSTQPKRAATNRGVQQIIDSDISIHAAQEGCDYSGNSCECRLIDFNPRSPRGLRQSSISSSVKSSSFQSTQPKRAATTVNKPFDYIKLISIHAAQEGCDGKCLKTCPLLKDFNPRSPRGLRPTFDGVYLKNSIFQSTQPKRAATDNLLPFTVKLIISIHAAQEGCDQYLTKHLTSR